MKQLTKAGAPASAVKSAIRTIRDGKVNYTVELKASTVRGLGNTAKAIGVSEKAILEYSIAAYAPLAILQQMLPAERHEEVKKLVNIIAKAGIDLGIEMAAGAIRRRQKPNTRLMLAGRKPNHKPVA